MNCPICFSGGCLHLRQVRDIHYNIKGEFDVYRCANCGSLYLTDGDIGRYKSLSHGEATDLYEANDYYAYDNPSEASRFFKYKANWLKRNRNYETGVDDLSIMDKMIYFILLPYLNDRLWWIPFQSGKKRVFIDIGCGAGKLVKLFVSLGYEAWGTDISSYGSAIGSSSGLKIVTGDFGAVELSQNYYDFIHSNHAIEHMADPHAVFKKISVILKPGGVGYVCVPNAESISLTVFGRYWYFLGTPVHFVNYTEKSLRIILEKYGLQVTHVKKVGDYQAVVGSLQAFLNRNTGKKSADGFIFNNALTKGFAMFISYLGTWLNVGSHLQVQFRKL